MQQATHRSLSSYLFGYLSSVALTVVAFLLVYTETLSGWTLITVVSLFALVQAALQLKYFLHLGEEGKPHWETAFFFFTMLILFIIVAGSLWVMNDLNERMMEHHKEAVVHD